MAVTYIKEISIMIHMTIVNPGKYLTVDHCTLNSMKPLILWSTKREGEIKYCLYTNLNTAYPGFPGAPQSNSDLPANRSGQRLE